MIAADTTPATRDGNAHAAGVATYSIAEVAEKLGLSAHTLRYYERIGLLDVARDRSGRRQYTDADVSRVLFITRLRSTAMPISRIQHYFALVAAGDGTERERLALLEHHREEVRARLAALEEALAAIEFKIAVYGGNLDDCMSKERNDA
jgi:DNA-binding transcriptional MerR regulator